jgi:hypothetical protein
MQNMNPEKFLYELKELRCHADWHKRYFNERSRKYQRIDYWLKSLIGVAALGGAGLCGVKELRIIGAFIAGACAVIMANVLPNFKWDAIVAGFKDEQENWIKIHQGYEDLIRVMEISDRGEILLQEFQRVREMQRAAALNEKTLPIDRALLEKLEAEVRNYYELDGQK